MTYYDSLRIKIGDIVTPKRTTKDFGREYVVMDIPNDLWGERSNRFICEPLQGQITVTTPMIENNEGLNNQREFHYAALDYTGKNLWD